MRMARLFAVALIAALLSLVPVSAHAADGDFIRVYPDDPTGPVYRIVGGAPIYVSTWAAVGRPRRPALHRRLAGLLQQPPALPGRRRRSPTTASTPTAGPGAPRSSSPTGRTSTARSRRSASTRARSPRPGPALVEAAPTAARRHPIARAAPRRPGERRRVRHRRRCADLRRHLGRHRRARALHGGRHGGDPQRRQRPGAVLPPQLPPARRHPAQRRHHLLHRERRRADRHPDRRVRDPGRPRRDRERGPAGQVVTPQRTSTATAATTGTARPPTPTPTPPPAHSDRGPDGRRQPW